MKTTHISSDAARAELFEPILQRLDACKLVSIENAFRGEQKYWMGETSRLAPFYYAVYSYEESTCEADESDVQKEFCAFTNALYWKRYQQEVLKSLRPDDLRIPSIDEIKEEAQRLYNATGIYEC